MQNDTTTTVHVALDVHKDSIIAAYSVGLGEVQNLGNVGVLERDITKLCTRMQSKGSHVSFVRRPPAKVSRIIQVRHEHLPQLVIDRAWDAQLRLCSRFRKLTARGKHKNVAAVSVARELAAFIWDIARMTRVPPAA